MFYKIIKSFNKHVGAIVFNKNDFKELKDYGVNFIVYSVDSKIISSVICWKCGIKRYGYLYKINHFGDCALDIC